MLNRRQFLAASGAAAATLAVSGRRARATSHADWRTFDITTRIDIIAPKGPTRVWVPLPLSVETDYQKSLHNQWKVPGGTASLRRDPRYAVTFLAAEWPEGVKPALELLCRVATRDRAIDLNAKRDSARLDVATQKLYTQPTRLIPVDGIVAATAQKIVAGVPGDAVKRARAIYEWIVENTFRDPKVRGCGVGDIKSMLEVHNLGGKCADINALFVGMVRSVGIPARDVYGLRVADSRRGYKVLGKSGDITKAQHCRAEFFADGRGWIPADPADVRKVLLEEPPGNLPVDHPKVAEARSFLFSAWEMNWIAYNTGHDVVLPKSDRGPVDFLMYPQAETADGRLDCLDPANFKYQIASSEITA
jgi:transglutaminase-like putative cysteine protease